MENTELKHILVAYKSTNIGLQQAYDEILQLFSIVGQSEQLKKCLYFDWCKIKNKDNTCRKNCKLYE